MIAESHPIGPIAIHPPPDRPPPQNIFGHKALSLLVLYELWILRLDTVWNSLYNMVKLGDTKMKKAQDRLPKILTSKEVAAWLGCSVKWVQDLANHPNEGVRLPCRRISPRGQMRFLESEVVAWLDAQRYDRKFAVPDHQ
jgi:predicted DNA-binding transcriptional regulator AlpA